MGQSRAKSYKYWGILLLYLLISIQSFAWERRTDSVFYASASAGMFHTNLINENYFQRLHPAWSNGYELSAYFKPYQEFGFTAGILYQSRQFQIDDVIPWYNETQEMQGYAPAYYTLNDISIPLKARYNFGKKINLYVHAGAQVNFRLSAERHAIFDTIVAFTGNPKDYIQDVSVDHPKISFTVLAGGGFEYYLKTNFAVYAEYNWQRDLSGLFVYDNIAGGVDPKMVTNSLQIGVRYGIPIRYSVARRYQ